MNLYILSRIIITPIFIICSSTLFHQQYAMEQEKTLSRNIESLSNLALNVFLAHADFDNINIDSVKFLDDLPQAPKISEYLRKKYIPHYKSSTEDITFSRTNVSSFSCDGQTLLMTRPFTIDCYELNHDHFKLQKTNLIEYKHLMYVFNSDNDRPELQEVIECAYLANSRIVQFGSNNYIVWGMSLYQEYNPDSTPISLKNKPNKEIVGIAKSNNCNNIFVAKRNGKKLSIVKEYINKKFEIIDEVCFKNPINLDTIVISKNGGCVILEDATTKNKFIWDRKNGTYSSLAHCIKPSDQIADVLNVDNGNYVLIKNSANATTSYLNLKLLGSQQQEIFFSRKYPTNINALDAKFIEKNNQIIGIITGMRNYYKVHEINFTISLFQYCSKLPTNVLRQIIDQETRSQ